MPFSNYIERLQNKPEKEKKKILFFGTIVITAFIFLFWAFFLSPGITQIDDNDGGKSTDVFDQFNEIYTFSSDVFLNIKTGADTVKNEFLYIIDYGKEEQ